MQFRIKPADTFIWNLSELIDFLVAHQHKEIIINNGTEGCCAETVGLYKWLDKFEFTSVTIETSNILETHSRYNVIQVLPWKFVEVKQTIDSEFHCWNRNAVFGTVYGRPLWHRLGLASHLLVNHSNISRVGFVTNPTNEDQRKLYEIAQLWQHSPVDVVNFANIQHLYPLLHPEIDEYTPGITLTDGFVAQSKHVYPNFLVDIVAETFTTGNCFFITEKTVRPMLLKKPFIAMAGKDHLLYLRQMGFKTFNEFWDEDYDGFADAERYRRIINLIDNLASKSIEELESMYHGMSQVLDHNYNLLLTQKYKKTVIKI